MGNQIAHISQETSTDKERFSSSTAEVIKYQPQSVRVSIYKARRCLFEMLSRPSRSNFLVRHLSIKGHVSLAEEQDSADPEEVDIPIRISAQWPTWPRQVAHPVQLKRIPFGGAMYISINKICNKFNQTFLKLKTSFPEARSLHIYIHTYVHTYIIGHYKLSFRIIVSVSHTTYVVCVNFYT